MTIGRRLTACPTNFLGAAAALLAALLLISCRSPQPRPESFVPADTIVLAGLHLDQLRTSPIYAKLPIAVGIVESVHNANQVLLAYNGKALTMIAAGPFQAAPAGWRLVAPGVAVSGTPAPGSRSWIVEQARPFESKPAWIVVEGGVPLPLSGNAANVMPLLRNSEWAALTLTLPPQAMIEATFRGRTPDAGVELERALRAILSLAVMAEKRGSETAAIIGKVRIEREVETVRASVPVTPESFDRLAQSLAK